MNNDQTINKWQTMKDKNKEPDTATGITLVIAYKCLGNHLKYPSNMLKPL